MEQSMRVVNWNVEWAPKGRRRALAEVLTLSAPDLLCLTETRHDLEGQLEHSIDAGTDWGYPNELNERRKVQLSSREPWSGIDSVGNPEMPPGRYVSGVSDGIRWIGVCIPWRDAHVSTGHRDRARWEDHRAFLAGLRGVVRGFEEAGEPVCLLGDFNQRVPKGWQPQDVLDALLEVLGEHIRLVTAGVVSAGGKHLIDHVAVGPGLDARVERVIEDRDDSGVRLSDHTGVIVEVNRIELTPSSNLP
jgi:exonuclease III